MSIVFFSRFHVYMQVSLLLSWCPKTSAQFRWFRESEVIRCMISSSSWSIKWWGRRAGTNQHVHAALVSLFIYPSITSRNEWKIFWAQRRHSVAGPFWAKSICNAIEVLMGWARKSWLQAASSHEPVGPCMQLAMMSGTPLMLHLVASFPCFKSRDSPKIGRRWEVETPSCDI